MLQEATSRQMCDEKELPNTQGRQHTATPTLREQKTFHLPLPRQTMLQVNTCVKTLSALLMPSQDSKEATSVADAQELFSSQLSFYTRNLYLFVHGTPICATV